MVNRIKNINWNKLSWVVAIEAAILIVAISFFSPGGDDLYRYYIPFARGSLESGFIPFFARWVVWPLGFLQPHWGWPVWLAICMAGWLALCRWTGINPALVMLSFPLLGQAWLGQIDVIICAGLALALLAKNPYARGIGVILALIKPQVAGIALFILLTRERQLLKVLAAPVITLISSFLVFGWHWPIEWLTNASNNLPPHVWRLAAGDVWPLGLLLLWVPFVFKDRRQRFEAGTLVSSLAIPYVGVYSYVIFQVFAQRKWWSLPLSFTWLLAIPIFGENAMRIAWIYPLILLMVATIKAIMEKRKPMIGLESQEWNQIKGDPIH